MSVTSQEAVQERYLTWVRGLYAQRRHGEGDRLGSLNFIDDDARRRGRDCVRTGRTLSLARPVQTADENGGCSVTVFQRQLSPTTVMAGDHIEIDCHGFDTTHIDALNHMAYDRRWYDGRSVDSDLTDHAPPTSVLDLADVGIFTRGIHVDVPRMRGVDWVTADEPVTADDIERAVSAAGVSFRPGDALLLDSGRDRYEREHGSPAATASRGGSGTSVAEWLVDARPSLVCWDMQDVANATEPRGSIHLLLWAIGLVLVDNCDFRNARPALREQHDAAVVVAPLRIPGATGSIVNPLVIL